MELIGAIVSQIVSIAIPEGVALGKEHLEQKKRIEQVETELHQILRSERENWYYDDLMQVLTNSTLLRDILNGCLKGQPVLAVDDRINELLLHGQINEAEYSPIKGVISKMIESIQSVMLTPSSGEEARLTFRYNAIQDKCTDAVEQLERINARLPDQRSNELYLSEIEGHCEPLRDVSCMIVRKLIESTNNDADDKRLCWTDVLQMKRRIAIVNDAGVGKTYALHQLCHAAKAQGHSVVYLSLNKYPGIPLFEKLLTKYLEDSKKVVLVLDGYDEIKPEYVSRFISVLNDIGKRFADMTIIISSRSNFFACHPLPYELFRLADITEQERIAYVEERDINPVSFFSQVRERRLEDICRNVFYFVELVRLWQKDGSLPDEADIMEAIIDNRIRSDWEKYKLSTPELSEHTASLRKLLERIAFVMQCTHQLQLTAMEMLQICTRDECEQLRLHGMWEDDATGNWTFAHNNFREYFAACWLRRQSWEQIVSYISWAPDKQKVKPSWMNVLAYMAKMKNSRDLQDWIAHNDPSIITLFERERFSEAERFEIFKRIYDQHEENLTWADVDYDAQKRMGAFASGGMAVEYILDKLTKKLHLRQEKNLLRVMAFFESLYGQEDDCKLVISSIAFDDDYPDHTREDALNVMRRFPQVFMEFAAKAAERSISSDSMDYRYHLQCFIEATGRLDDYFEIIIHELQQHERDEEVHSISRTLFLEHLCSTVKSEKSVLRLFEFASEHPEYINKSPFKEAWSNLFDVAAHCQDSYREKFLFAVLNLFSVEQRRCHTEIDELIMAYMVETKSEEAFLESILSYEDFAIPYAIRNLACSSLINVLVEYYNKDCLIYPDIVERMIKLLPNADPLQNRLIKAVYLKTGVEIAVSKVVDYEELRRKGKQDYFDALFSKAAFSVLVEDLCGVLGKETPVKEKSYVDCTPWDRKTALTQCLYALRRTVANGNDVTLGAAIEGIKEWDWFQYYNVSCALRGDKEISINSVQKEWMEDYTRDKLSGIDTIEIRRKYFNERRYYSNLQLMLETAAKLDMSFHLETFCSFVLIPSFLFGESDPTTFPQYLLDHIPEKEMENLVLHNIGNEELREGMAAAHLNYCTEHRLYGAKDFAKRFLSEEESVGYRYSALNYISKLYGTDVILDEVVPLRDDERFLLDVAYHIPLHLSAPLLHEKLESTFAKNPTPRLMELMIKRNHRTALERYCEQADKLQTLPDMTEGCQVPSITESIRHVNDIRLIDIIIKLLSVTNQPGFRDKETFGLRSACCESIKNIASKHYDDVKIVLINEKDQASGDQKLICIDLLQRIDEMYQFSIDKGVSFEVALALTTS